MNEGDEVLRWGEVGMRVAELTAAMISVPQLLAAIMGVGVALGAGGAMLVISTSRKKRLVCCADYDDMREV